MRLDHLQGLVDHGGAVDTDLAPHLPDRVGQGFGYRDLPAPAAEKGAAAGGQEDPAHRPVRVGSQDLEDGVVFAVQGDDPDAPAPGGPGQQFPGHDHGLLAGQGQGPSGFQYPQGDGQRIGARDGQHEKVHPRPAGQPVQPFGSGQDPGARGLEARLRDRPAESDRLRTKLAHLLLEEVMTVMAGEADHPEAAREAPDDRQGAVSDGTGGAEDDDLFHRDFSAFSGGDPDRLAVSPKRRWREANSARAFLNSSRPKSGQRQGVK
ncbi:MAG: hypothetical protein BWY73_01565 [candidate division TA06 bacterium ADurb.Bin417]|uniref:Uncharacterized protein n=1 Tax=candidate division TA06 bacterium ADurb.Bin417 TaxID=1852828 RepID=A0A1V5M8A0_UNCT6|nr:MAG: hypothetical protein BWY73_01565 [candidate division TA06 bacterium ADurb.Bin417]